MTKTNEVRIENCTFCNYGCKFCPHSTEAFTRKKEIMSNDLFFTLLKKVKRESPQITECTLSGFGEAFLDQDILHKIKIAKDLHYNVHILTNGSMLTKKIIDELIKLKICDFRISLHTIHEDEYNILTNSSGKFQHIIEMIEYIVNHPYKSNMNLIITADVIDINKEHINDLIEELKNKVDLLEVWKPHNWGNWGQYREGHKNKKTCGRPFNGPLQIQVDGTINMCCFDFNGELLLGDLKTQSLQEIFNSKEYKRIKNFHENNIKDEDLLCNECDQLIGLKNIILYNSKYMEEERVKLVSTTYGSLI